MIKTENYPPAPRAAVSPPQPPGPPAVHAYRAKLSDAEQEKRDKWVASEIQVGRCPFGSLKPGQTLAHCPGGFPGCACADELELNPYLASERASRDEQYARHLECGPLAADEIAKEGK